MSKSGPWKQCKVCNSLRLVSWKLARWRNSKRTFFCTLWAFFIINLAVKKNQKSRKKHTGCREACNDRSHWKWAVLAIVYMDILDGKNRRRNKITNCLPNWFTFFQNAVLSTKQVAEKFEEKKLAVEDKICFKRKNTQMWNG